MDHNAYALHRQKQGEIAGNPVFWAVWDKLQKEGHLEGLPLDKKITKIGETVKAISEEVTHGDEHFAQHYRRN